MFNSQKNSTFLTRKASSNGFLIAPFNPNLPTLRSKDKNLSNVILRPKVSSYPKEPMSKGNSGELQSLNSGLVFGNKPKLSTLIENQAS